MEPLLEVNNLGVEIPTRHGTVHAVQGISYELGRGERLGIMGESGSGKTIAALAVMRLLLPPARVVSGTVSFDGRNLLEMSVRAIDRWRGAEASMIFQDPLTALNPFLRIGIQVSEGLEIHRGLSRTKALVEARRLLERVQISDPERRIDEFPHQISGGMRQRVAIAIAMATRPKMIVADEPTTALDVTAQANILDLLRQMAAEEGTSVILITHDPAVVADFCERVVVMYAGRIVEQGTVDEVMDLPLHPYAQALLESVPQMSGPRERRLTAIPGAPPDLTRPSEGCPFAPRCRQAKDRCRTERPLLRTGPSGRSVACHFAPLPETPVIRGGGASR